MKAIVPRIGGPVVRVFSLAFVLYAYFMPRWADWNIDSRLDLVHSIVDDHSLKINRYHWNTWDKAVVNNRDFYSDKAPGTAFLGVVAYAGLQVARATPLIRTGIQQLERNHAWDVAIRLGKSDTQVRPAARGINLGGCQRAGTAGNVQYIPWGNRLVPPMRQWALSKYVVSVVTVSFLSALFVAFFFWFLGVYTRRQVNRWLLTLLFAVGTVAFPYSTVFYSHELVAGFLFVAFALLFLYRQEGIGKLAAPIAGFLFGMALFTEYTVAIIVAILGAYALWVLRRDPRSLGLMALAGSLPVIGLLAYNYACFGGPLDTGYTHDFCWSAAQGGGLAGFTTPKPGPLWDLTLGSFRGLFYTSPFLLLAAPGAVIMWRRGHQLEATICIVCATVFIVAISAYWGWNGGKVDGPRYLVPIVPFIAFPIVFLFDKLGRSLFAWVVVAIAAAWSLFATWALFLGGELFPISWLRNPLFDYSLPELKANHIAPNAGFFLGLSGWLSLLPLLALLVVIGSWNTGRLFTRFGKPS
jgi:hypothetical protein